MLCEQVTEKCPLHTLSMACSGTTELAPGLRSHDFEELGTEDKYILEGKVLTVTWFYELLWGSSAVTSRKAHIPDSLFESLWLCLLGQNKLSGSTS